MTAAGCRLKAKGQKVPVPAGSTVIVREHRDGSLTLVRNHHKLRWHELEGRPKKLPMIPSRRLVQRPKPAPDHPWRKALAAAP